MKSRFLMATLITLTISCALYATEPKMGQQVTANAEFERLKTLVGKWEGTHKSKNGEEKVPLTYELSSAGTALVEKLSAGDAHEMISVYHQDGKNVAMTHYCAIGNQPEMKAEKVDKKSMSFNFVRGSNMTSDKDPHMHALKLTWINSDQLKQEWTFFENGKPVSTEVFTFKRVK